MSTRRIKVGKSACPDSKVHRWPERQSIGQHTFGAAAFEKEDGLVEVTFYADVFGKRTGELEYAAEAWDEAMRRIVETKGNMQAGYNVLDEMVRAFGHAPLNTMVEFDPNAPVEQQVKISRPNDARVITDSVASAGAFLIAASEGEFFSPELLTESHIVPEDVYYEHRPVSLQNIG